MFYVLLLGFKNISVNLFMNFFVFKKFEHIFVKNILIEKVIKQNLL